MDGALLDFPPTIPTARELMARALDPHVLIGMPHLTPRGLSETWLMKELGHRHWLMLARHMGMDNADFRTSDGEEAYAAICATRLRRADFRQVTANAILTIRSTLTPVSRTQMSSVHRLSVDAVPIGEVELISTFVHRQTKGDNHSIARVQCLAVEPAKPGHNALAGVAAEMRANRQALSSGIRGSQVSVFRTSPSQEFNGAGLFYFAEFQALMERALEEHSPYGAGQLDIVERDVFFFGNVREGEELTVEICHQAENASEFRIRRGRDTIIAFSRCRRIEVGQ